MTNDGKQKEELHYWLHNQPNQSIKHILWLVIKT